MTRKQLAALVLGCALAGCGSGDSCRFANDGVCDEPRNCAFGTDSSDCSAACARGDTSSAGAACAWRGLPASGNSAPKPGVGSQGQGGLSGVWDGTLSARGPA